jgi:O-antigen chain-terminating methyltransferase
MRFCPNATAVDLGCGRGEWLESMRDLGFQARGVDLDEAMLSTCRDLGLAVEVRDAVSFLASESDASHAIVSAFHLVEHVSFSELTELVREALRVLLPGGMLILETPNPENLVVGCSRFYLDPTHKRPIPAELLSFLAEYTGFERVKVLRLQESAALRGDSAVALRDVLDGVSPDYALVAQKSGPEELFAVTAPAFEAEYGIGLAELAVRYDGRWQAGLQELDARTCTAEERAEMEARAVRAEADARVAQAESAARVAQAESAARVAQLELRLGKAETDAELARAEHLSQIADLERRAAGLEGQSQELQAMLDAIHATNHNHWQLSELRQQQLEAIYNSHSWRITAPIRAISTAVSGLFSRADSPARWVRALTRPMLSAAMRSVMARPSLRERALGILAKHPTLKAHLRSFAAARGLIALPAPEHPEREGPHAERKLTVDALTERARTVHADLKAVLTAQSKDAA